jgi:hypothetical protein
VGAAASKGKAATANASSATQSADFAVGIKTERAVATLFHRAQDLVKRQRRERSGIVGYPIGNDELPIMHEAAA